MFVGCGVVVLVCFVLLVFFDCVYSSFVWRLFVFVFCVYCVVALVALLVFLLGSGWLVGSGFLRLGCIWCDGLGWSVVWAFAGGCVFFVIVFTVCWASFVCCAFVWCFCDFFVFGGGFCVGVSLLWVGLVFGSSILLLVVVLCLVLFVVVFAA